MSAIRIPNNIYTKTNEHLFGKPGEHFAFYLANYTYSGGKPVFLVKDLDCIPDDETMMGWDGYEVKIESILRVVNLAVENDHCLIEAHNHGGSVPRFSMIDQAELGSFVEYIHESLPGKPYCATVWGDTEVFGKYYLPNGASGEIRSIAVFGDGYKQIVSKNETTKETKERYSRQEIWFSRKGQQQFGRMRIGVVGVGGTGSHVVQQLTYLGCEDFVLIDDDRVEETNLNRLVIAGNADTDLPKVYLAQQMIKKINPEACVLSIEEKIQSANSIDALKGVDIIFGCVDNDGARLIMNELALAYHIPYIDLATGIAVENGEIVEAGGRVVFVSPNGPCLLCLDEIDRSEAAFFLGDDEEREEQLTRGYISGINAESPSVVSLNGSISSLSINELAVVLSGLRPNQPVISLDILGRGREVKSQYVSPWKADKKDGCVHCALAGTGDKSNVGRYGRNKKNNNKDVSQKIQENQ